MGTANRPDRTLHASLCEIERGLFHASYRHPGLAPDGAALGTDRHYLPIYQVARSASVARQGIEQSARAVGYDTVIWEDTGMAPVLTAAARGRDHLPVEQVASPH
jgi:hypothetical protein